MHTTQANFSNDAIAQAIAGAQAMVERLEYRGTKARKGEKKEYTVKAVYKNKQGKEVQIIDHFIAGDESEAMSEFADTYGIRATHAYRTRLSHR